MLRLFNGQGRAVTGMKTFANGSTTIVAERLTLRREDAHATLGRVGERVGHKRILAWLL